MVMLVQPTMNGLEAIPATTLQSCISAAITWANTKMLIGVVTSASAPSSCSASLWAFLLARASPKQSFRPGMRHAKDVFCPPEKSFSKHSSVDLWGAQLTGHHARYYLHKMRLSTCFHHIRQLFSNNLSLMNKWSLYMHLPKENINQTSVW